MFVEVLEACAIRCGADQLAAPLLCTTHVLPVPQRSCTSSWRGWASAAIRRTPCLERLRTSSRPSAPAGECPVGGWAGGSCSCSRAAVTRLVDGLGCEVCCLPGRLAGWLVGPLLVTAGLSDPATCAAACTAWPYCLPAGTSSRTSSRGRRGRSSPTALRSRCAALPVPPAVDWH